MTFPEGWPEGCPPQDATDANGTLFRIVSSNPPGPDDFLSAEEQGNPDPKRPCESVGISLFQELIDVLHYKEKYPYLGDLIANAALSSEHGKTKPTPRRINNALNSHTTWWPFSYVQRHTLFAVHES